MLQSKTKCSYGMVEAGNLYNVTIQFTIYGTRYLMTTVIGSFITQLFKSFKFRNGGRMSDENHVILEFKYLKNKKMVETSCRKC